MLKLMQFIHRKLKILRVYTLAASCQIYPSDIFYLICTVFYYQLATIIKTGRVHYTLNIIISDSDNTGSPFPHVSNSDRMVASSGNGDTFPPAMTLTTPYYSKIMLKTAVI